MVEREIRETTEGNWNPPVRPVDPLFIPLVRCNIHRVEIDLKLDLLLDLLDAQGRHRP